MVRQDDRCDRQRTASAPGPGGHDFAGVGPERAAQLARLEIRTSRTCCGIGRPGTNRRHFSPSPAATGRAGHHAPGIAHGVKWYQHHTRSIFELILDDGTARLHCRWWNLPFMEKYFAVGQEVIAFGKPVNLKPRTLDHPETEVCENGEEDFTL